MDWPKAPITTYLLQAFGITLALTLVVFPNADTPVWAIGLVRGVFGVLVYAWVLQDAERLQLPAGRKLASFSAILPEIGVPIYLFKSRVFWGALFALTRIAVFVVLVAVLAVSIGRLLKHTPVPDAPITSEATRTFSQR